MTAFDEDSDEIFRRMVEDLDINPDNTGIVDVSVLQDVELLSRFNQTKSELYERQELLAPHTDTGRDLSATYHACLLELKKRRIM